jgi:hypothetical protein
MRGSCGTAPPLLRHATEHPSGIDRSPRTGGLRYLSCSRCSSGDDTTCPCCSERELSERESKLTLTRVRVERSHAGGIRSGREAAPFHLGEFDDATKNALASSLEPKRIREIDRITVREAVQTQLPGQPDGVFLGEAPGRAPVVRRPLLRGCCLFL